MNIPNQDGKLDVEQVIRRARLRSCREPDSVLVGLLFQELHRRDPQTRMEFMMIVDEGRSVREQLFAVNYQGDVWTVNGRGGWGWQLMQALARNSQTWKNPKLASISQSDEDMLNESMLVESFPLSTKLRHRINAAVSFVEGKALGDVAPGAPSVRKSPRL